MTEALDMLVQSPQREDIKAALRKRHGSVRKFAAKKGVKYQAVVDWLRGRPNGPVAKLVRAEMVRAKRDGMLVDESIMLDHNSETAEAHRQNAEAR
jgi:lambda repressor-like predicted transcriptional regulator